MSTVWLEGLAALADRFDGLLVDQYGVLHNGRQSYPGAVGALAAWRALGKRCIVFSNSGKRAAYNAQRLLRFGISPAHYDQVLSSGELTHQMLQARTNAPWNRLGTRACTLMREDAEAMLQGLPIELVETPSNADFVLLVSLPEQTTLATWDAWLAQALERRLPLVCANPDLWRLTTRGSEPALGALAKRYAELGGEVVWVGKPYSLIYAACQQQMATRGATRLLALGDSLTHDIQGGAAAGMDTCFIAAGLHAQAFSELSTNTERQALLSRLCADPVDGSATAPNWAMNSLRW